MQYQYFICDVFTSKRFGGNQLAVLPDARGLSGRQMQQVAREFNFSETTFVLPPEAGHTKRVRIFTPATEVPFAGHPNIGTAFVLAGDGAFGDIGDQATVTFEEKAGLVAVEIQRRGESGFWCELTAPQGLTLGKQLPPGEAAAVLSLPPDAVSTAVHPPSEASVGLHFLIVELTGLDALAQAQMNLARVERLQKNGITPDVLLYTRNTGDETIRARMFAPFDGVPEDPATGSANCALAALLSHCDEAQDRDFEFRIVQGVEMGRPSYLDARARKRGGEIIETRIGGDCVLVASGHIEVD